MVKLHELWIEEARNGVYRLRGNKFQMDMFHRTAFPLHNGGKAIFTKGEGNREKKLYIGEVNNGIYILRRGVCV